MWAVEGVFKDEGKFDVAATEPTGVDVDVEVRTWAVALCSAASGRPRRLGALRSAPLNS